jgi:hypothetical protein
MGDKTSSDLDNDLVVTDDLGGMTSEVGEMVIDATLGIASSSSSLSGGRTEDGGVGGRTAYFDCLSLWFFGFRGKIDPAQPLTFFLLFLLSFFSLAVFGVRFFDSAASAWDSDSCSEDEPPETARDAESPELELCGRALVGLDE